MGLFLTFIQDGWWALEYSVAACLLLTALKKRQHFNLHLLLGLLGILLIDRLGIAFMPVPIPLPVILFLICVAMVGVFYLCAEIDIWDAIFGSVCSYAIQHLSYAAHSFLSLALGARIVHHPD